MWTDNGATNPTPEYSSSHDPRNQLTRATDLPYLPISCFSKETKTFLQIPSNRFRSHFYKVSFHTTLGLAPLKDQKGKYGTVGHRHNADIRLKVLRSNMVCGNKHNGAWESASNPRRSVKIVHGKGRKGRYRIGACWCRGVRLFILFYSGRCTGFLIKSCFLFRQNPARLSWHVSLSAGAQDGFSLPF